MWAQAAQANGEKLAIQAVEALQTLAIQVLVAIQGIQAQEAQAIQVWEVQEVQALEAQAMVPPGVGVPLPELSGCSSMTY